MFDLSFAMKQIITTLALTSLVLSGCGSPKEVAQDSGSIATSEATDVGQTQLKLKIEKDIVPLTKADEEFSRRIQVLSSEANKLQYNFDFSSASKKWREAETLLQNQFGADSWQTQNAKVAAETATVQAEFSAEQIELLKEVFNKQAQVSQALRDSNIDEALRLSHESTQMTETLFGAESFMMGKQLMQLARMNQHAGNVDAAATHFLKAVNTLKTILGEVHPDLEMGYAYLGEIYLAKADRSRAISHLTTSTAIARELWGEGSLRYSARANDLGVAYYRNKEYNSAVKVLRAAEAIRRERLTANHPQVAHSLTNLGVVYMELEQNDLANQCLTHAHSVFDQHYHSGHRLTSDCKSKLATVRLALGDAASAEKLLSELIANLQDSSSPQVTASLQYRLGNALTQQGKFRRAEPLLKSAMRIQTATFGKTDESTIKTMRSLSRLLNNSNRSNEANEIEAQIQRVAQSINEENTVH